MWLAGSIAASSYELMPVPEKGKSYPGDKQTLPYEDILDIAQVVLSGTVKSVEGDRIELTGVQVLHGKFDGQEATVSFSGKFGEESPDKDRSIVVLCLQDADGALRLAGDPPKGGGWVTEGRKLAEALLEASRDPAKGFESKTPAVQFSSAYRLARAWQAAPEGRKPKLPAGLVKVLIAGLEPDELRDRNVNAAARNALNVLLDNDISKLCRYSVTAPDEDRSIRTESVREAWTASVAAALKAGAKRPAAEPPKDGGKESETDRAAGLIAQLGETEWARREEAQEALKAMGRKIEKQLEAGTKSRDAEIAVRCQELLDGLRPQKDERSGEAPAAPLFDLKRVGALIEAGAG